MRWSQLGFGRTSTTSRSQETPRNLFGMKDGTANIKAEDTDAMDEFVWVDDGPAWMQRRQLPGHPPDPDEPRGLGPLLARDQEETIGRQKYNGAPLGGSEEFEPLPLEDKGVERQTGDPGETPTCGSPRRTENDGLQILRRGYSFTDGVDQSLGELEAGLFFIAFQRDPEKQFVALQRKLGQSRRAQRVHQARRQRRLRRPAGSRKGRLRRRSLFA